MTSQTTLARIAGALYLLLAICGGFSELYVRAGVKAPGDPAATARNIAESATLFGIGLGADLVNITCFLLTGLVLYALLGRVNRAAAVAMTACNAVCVAIMSLNMVNHAAALTMATDRGRTAALGAETSAALAALFLDLHSYGYAIAQIFFGLWLLPLGYLILKSGFLPRPLGVLVMVGCAGYLAGIPFTYLISGADDLAMIITLPAFIAELSLIGWLLIKALNPVQAPTSSRTPPPDDVRGSAVRAEGKVSRYVRCTAVAGHLRLILPDPSRNEDQIRPCRARKARAVQGVGHRGR